MGAVTDRIRRDADGAHRFIFDIGSDRPAPVTK